MFTLQILDGDGDLDIVSALFKMIRLLGMKMMDASKSNIYCYRYSNKQMELGMFMLQIWMGMEI